MLAIKYGLYKQNVFANSSLLRRRTSLDRRWEIGDEALLYSWEASKWLPATVVKTNIDADLTIILEYYKPGDEDVRQKKIPRVDKNLRRADEDEPHATNLGESQIEYIDCDGFEDINKESWELNEGAAQFKKTHFSTALLQRPQGVEQVFLFNYTKSQYNTRPWHHWNIMVEHYQDGVFEFDTLCNMYGYCKEGYWIMQEYFPKGNLQTFVRFSRFRHPEWRKVLPTMLMYVLKSILDLNSKGIIMCDWKPDQWMILDAEKGIVKLNDVDSTIRVRTTTESGLKYCNCPFRFNPFYHKNRPPEGWVNRTWGDKMWFKGEGYHFPEFAVESKPIKYEAHCAHYHVHLRDNLKLPIEQYWFQAARASEMIYVIIMKSIDVVVPATRLELKNLARQAVGIWEPMSMNDLFARTQHILKDYLLELDF